jgi:trehalose 6-phosphate synthase/phosphatase
LVPFVAIPEEARPDEDILKILSSLVNSTDTRVVIISGRGSELLEDWLGDVGVNLVAEHGARMRQAESGDWALTAGDGSTEWMDQLRPVFEVFVDRTPGSRLEEKGAALVWHYRAADPGLGSLRAKELADTLEGYIANTPLHILQGSRTVEVKQSNVSKGKAAQVWLERGPSSDFILAIGDDVTDEDMFEVLPQDAWSIKVGFAKHSNARFYLSRPSEVRRLLAELTRPG